MTSTTPTHSERSFASRRSPLADSSGPPPPNVPPRAMSPGLSNPPRTSSSADTQNSTPNSSVTRRANGSAPSPNTPQTTPVLSQIEQSVTHLLVATKQLLETLTQWSRGRATDAQVSDVYVRLGYEFNIACRAFAAINVNTNDLGNVPELLRTILESTLSQEASVESLEKYLPRIRDIIINLLHGLKRKQQKLRLKQQRDGTAVEVVSVPRTSSVSSVGSANTANTGLTTLLDQGISGNFQSDEPAKDTRDSGYSDRSSKTEIPPRMSSAVRRGGMPVRDPSRGSISSEQSTLSSTTMQNMPVVPPYPGDEMPTQNGGPAELSVDSFPPPPPPPKQQNALAALQRGGDLERRASRRYSAYQISKHLGASPNGVPMMPPVQNSPLPNRGRNDARESMRAVQNRGDQQRHARQQSTRMTKDVSPSRVPSMITEEEGNKIFVPPTAGEPIDSPTVKTPEDKLRQSIVDFDGPTATLKGPPSDAYPILTEPAPRLSRQIKSPLPALPNFDEPPETQAKETSAFQTNQRRFSPELTPPPGKELTIFLQYKTKIKKFVLTDGYNDLSVARLQLAFIEKFAWNTHNNGVDLPEIYIQDPVSGVRHELEDLSDIKDRAVLVLNVEVLDEVKRHIDEGLGGIKKIIESVKVAVDDQQASIQRVSDRQRDSAKEIARLASAPPPSAPVPATTQAPFVLNNRPSFNSKNSPKGDQGAIAEIQSLRRDLAVLRQTYSSFQNGIQDSMVALKSKATTVKVVAAKVVETAKVEEPIELEGDKGRRQVYLGKKELSKDADKLVARVDDLQDLVEDLRKDVVLRGVRPLARQLEAAAKDLAQATFELQKMQNYMKREKPVWTKIWEKELEHVCNDREELTLQEDLAADLEDDLEKATQTFALVEQACKEQMKENPNPIRAVSRGLNHVSIDPSAAKEGVLGEVRALQPNHEGRLEAIERAEKLRQIELESRRGGEFQKELGNFVEEGKLKKSGGFEEVERARKAKDDRIRREIWERQNGITQADAMAEEPLDEAKTDGEAEKQVDATPVS